MNLKSSQEAVKRAYVISSSEELNTGYELVDIKPGMLRNLRNEVFDESMAKFGIRLARAITPNHKSFTRQYIHRLESGLDRITPEIEAAYWNIATALDDVPAGTGGAVTVHLLAQPNQVIDGAFIPRSTVMLECASPGCAVKFVRTSPRQRYHDPECRKKDYRRSARPG